MEALKAILIALIAVFAPIQGVILTVLALIFADLVLGVFAAHKRGEKITSSGIRRTLTKIVVYEVAIMLGFLCETYLVGGAIPIVKVVAALVGAVEMKSVLESLDSINGSSLFTDLIKRLGSTNDNK